MNKFFLLIFAFSLITTGLATAQNRPKGNLNRAFGHGSKANAGKNNKAHFRHEATRPTIDLNPNTPGKFKTTRTNRHKLSKGR